MALYLPSEFYRTLPKGKAMWESMHDFVGWAFGGDAPTAHLTLMQVAARAVLLFLFGLAVVRLGKGRLLGRMTSLDILVAIILGSLLSRGMTGEASLSGTIVATIAIVATHYVLTSLAVDSHWLGKLIKGTQRQLIKDGEILWDGLRHSHISEHDLRAAIRLQAHTEDLSQIAAAYKERSGEISVIKRS